MHAVTYINLQSTTLDTKGSTYVQYLDKIYEDRKYISYLGLEGLERSKK